MEPAEVTAALAVTCSHSTGKIPNQHFIEYSTRDAVVAHAELVKARELRAGAMESADKTFVIAALRAMQAHGSVLAAGGKSWKGPALALGIDNASALC